MMKILISSLMIMFVLFACKNEKKIKQINVNDFGITANTNQSVTALVNQLIENLSDEPVKIIFPKGRYDFYSK